MKKFTLLFILFLNIRITATHNRAGEITYQRIAPFSKSVNNQVIPVYTYSIVVTKYQNYGDMVADRCVDTLTFGDGKVGIAPRVNGPICSSCGNAGNCGEIFNYGGGKSLKISVYGITHTYPGPGSYTIKSSDPNRNGDIINIPNSINHPFVISSLLVINSFTGANHSPVIGTKPIADATLHACFFHFPDASDADGDSLSYELSLCQAPNYSYPDAGNGGTFNINAVTGQLTWCHPQMLGTYAIAYTVKEWRKNSDGTYQPAGMILRDMEVQVIYAPVDLEENLHDKRFNLFPNPVNNELKITFARVHEITYTCTITSVAGKMIHMQQLTAGAAESQINIRDLPPGMYYLQLDSPEGRLTKKFIRQ